MQTRNILTMHLYNIYHFKISEQNNSQYNETSKMWNNASEEVAQKKYFYC